MKFKLSHNLVVSILTCMSFLSVNASAQSAKSAVVPAEKVVTYPPLFIVGNEAIDTYHGVQMTDPYRELEDVKNPKVQAWMKAQADFTRAVLNKIPNRQVVLNSIQKFDSAVSARVSQVTRVPGNLYFYQKRGASENQYKLYMRQGTPAQHGSSSASKEQLLVDPEAMSKATGKPNAINYYSVSPTGRYVAYGVSESGSEDASLYLLDTTTKKLIGEPITRANFGGVTWSPDSQSFYFNRLQELKAGMAETERYQKSQVLRLRVGQAIQQAQVILTAGIKANQNGTEIDSAEIPFVEITHDGKWAIASIINGVQREQKVFVAQLTDAKESGSAQASFNWQPVIAPSDDITAVTYAHNALFFITHKNAPRFRVAKLNLRTLNAPRVEERPQVSKAIPVVEQSEKVITGIVAAQDGLYIEARDGNSKRLGRVQYDLIEKRTPKGSLRVSETAEIKLPFSGAFALMSDEGSVSAANPRLPGVIFDLQGWTRASQIYEVAANSRVTNTGLQPKGRFDAPTDTQATEVKVRSHDGAMVPMSIIHKKGLRLDGTNPTILYGYASYGITEEPFFSIGRLAWLEQGGVFAIANPRGSAVYGQEWYKAGFQEAKPNTWKDFIACAEYLIKQKYTSPATLGILGGSAGGILVGRAMTERPDLFAAVVPAVGALDMLRAESTPNGIPNIPEFGSVKTEAGFKSLLAMSTYHQIKRGVNYPAVMFTHGVNDPRVEVWNSTKTAAQLTSVQLKPPVPTGGSASQVPPNPRVFLNLDFEAGHGVGSTKEQRNRERADIYSFMLWQFGVPQFQPK